MKENNTTINTVNNREEKEMKSNNISVENTVNNVKAFALEAKAKDLAGSIANNLASLTVTMKNITSFKNAHFSAYIGNTPVEVFVEYGFELKVRVTNKYTYEVITEVSVDYPVVEKQIHLPQAPETVELDKTHRGNSKFAPTTPNNGKEIDEEPNETCVSVNGKLANEIDKSDPTTPDLNVTTDDVIVRDNVEIPISSRINFRDIRVNFRDINIHIHTHK